VPYATYGFAAQIALVRVDTALGTVKVEEIVAAQDVGRAVNPLLVRARSMAASRRGSASR
jgi:aldehyde oxidoreductase